ncbi:MAG: DUF86 domain-containing protein [Methanomassiliicoccaceae archaeon]|nr:DUF86 domain-containing protein [Methanomassiliicoccaceae archaeon]
MRDDRLPSKTIIGYCNDIKEYIEYFGNSEEEFLRNTIFQRCCAFDVFQIGEAVKSLSKEIRDSHPDVQWRKIAGFRDVIAHNYGGIETDDLWIAITAEVPELKKSCERILIEISSKEV